MTNIGQREKLVLGGRVLTMERDTAPDWQGMVVRDGRIMRLIRRDEEGVLAGEGREVIDLGERTLMPGFVDVHAHAEVLCRTFFGTVDCRAPGCADVSDVQDALSSARREREPGAWIVGQGNLFYDRKLAEGRLPTRAELDAVSTEEPIAVRAGGHITVLNTKALELAGIDHDYVPPSYSVTGLPEVERDGDGNPTGVVKEMDTLLPFPAPDDRDALREALRNGLEENFTRFGVTTIGEISETVEGIECMDELATEGRLPVEMRVYLWAPGTLSVEQACNWHDHIYLHDPGRQVAIHGLKLFADGGFSARSAAVSCPYLGEQGCGSIAFARYFLRRAFEKTGRNGLQLSIHANGDRAQEWLCQQVIEMGGAPEGRLRTRIEHAGNLLPNESTKDWWAKAGVIPVPQPVFLYTFGEYFSDYLGEFGERGRFPFRTLLAEGWRLSGSSDVWIGSEQEATNPFFSIWCCIRRQAYSGVLIDEHEAITIEQALRMHTLDAAATLGLDDVQGSLVPGKRADVIALERDPREVPIDELRGMQADFVMKNGRTVLDRTGSSVTRAA